MTLSVLRIPLFYTNTTIELFALDFLGFVAFVESKKLSKIPTLLLTQSFTTKRRRSPADMVTVEDTNIATSSALHNEEAKNPVDHGRHVNLKVKGQDGVEVFFRIKSSSTLGKLMNAYCERRTLGYESIAFLHDGRRLRAENTPAEFNMEDGDEIDAMLHQIGGA